MKKNKKIKADKNTLLGGAAKSLKKLSKGTTSSLGRLSTAKKVVGGAALLAVGLSYFAKRRTQPAASGSATPAGASAAEESLAAMDGNA
ncbi:MAG: hypothetical protein NVSMB30_16690 [Hymenobacter sp.]